MKALKRLFLPKEVKEVFKLLNDFDKKYNGSEYGIIKKNIEKGILYDPKKVAEVIRQNESIYHYTLSAVANISGDLVESGQYHFYKGVLNPLREGPRLLEIFNQAVDELVEIGAVDSEFGNQQKKLVLQNIQDVG